MNNDELAKMIYDEVNSRDIYIIPSMRIDWEDLPEITKDVYRHSVRTISKDLNEDIEKEIKKEMNSDLYSDFDQNLAKIISAFLIRFIEETRKRNEVFLAHNNMYRIEEVTRAFPKDLWEEKSLEWCARVLEQYSKCSYNEISKLAADARRAMIYIGSNFTSLYL